MPSLGGAQMSCPEPAVSYASITSSRWKASGIVGHPTPHWLYGVSFAACLCSRVLTSVYRQFSSPRVRQTDALELPEGTLTLSGRDTISNAHMLSVYPSQGDSSLPSPYSARHL